MKVPDDIHPDDLAERDRLATELTRIREAAGISLYEIDKANGVNRGVCWSLERRRSWRVPTIQHHARQLGHRITFQLNNLPPPPADDADALAVILSALTTTSPEAEDARHTAIVCNDLIRIRHALGVAQAELAVRMNRTATAVRVWEEDHDRTTLVALQRYARVLREDRASSLTVCLERVDPPASAIAA